MYNLQGTNISHLGKRIQIIFKPMVFLTVWRWWASKLQQPWTHWTQLWNHDYQKHRKNLCCFEAKGLETGTAVYPATFSSWGVIGCDNVHWSCRTWNNLTSYPSSKWFQMFAQGSICISMYMFFRFIYIHTHIYIYNLSIPGPCINSHVSIGVCCVNAYGSHNHLLDPCISRWNTSVALQLNSFNGSRVQPYNRTNKSHEFIISLH